MNNISLKNDSKLEYINSFAVILEDGLIAHKHNSRIPIKNEDINRIIISKKRKVTLNWILFTIALSLLITWIFTNPFSQIITNILLSTCVILVIASLIVKKYKYKFIILKHNDEPISIALRKYEIKDAKAILKLMTKKLKKK